MQGSGIAFYASYIHSRTMFVHVVPMERGWKEDSNNTKYSKIKQYCSLKKL